MASDTLPMRGIPMELVLLIGGYLSIADNFRLRLVCKKLCDDVTPDLFKETEVAYLPNSFTNLLKISTCPSLNNHILSLSYYGLARPVATREMWEKSIQFPIDKLKQRPVHPRIPEAGMFSSRSSQDYMAEVKKWIEASHPTKFYQQAELNAGFQAYENAVAAATTLEAYGVDYQAMATSMRFLKNLKSITVTTNYHHDGSFSKKPSRVADLVANTGELLHLGNKKTELLAIRQITSVLRAVLFAKPKLESLEFHVIPWCVIGGTDFRLSVSVGAFVHMTHLFLEITDDADLILVQDHRIDYKGRQNTLGRALQSMKSLKVLKIMCHRLEPFTITLMSGNLTPLILWSRLFGDATWPELRVLHVSDICMEPSWLEFFPRHPKLRSLLLRDLYLLGGKSWIPAFNQMKKELVLLNSLKLQGEFWFKLEDQTEAGADGNNEMEEDNEGDSGSGGDDGVEVNRGAHDDAMSESNLDEDEDMEDDLEDWNMNSGMDQLGGDFQPEDDELTLGEHIVNWVLSNGPDPFVEENLAEKFRVNED